MAVETKAKPTTKKTTKKSVPKDTEAVKPAPKKAPEKETPKSDGKYAVLATGGKQYLVRVGDKLKIEKLSDKHKEGDEITFDTVLMTGMGATVTLGNPYIKGSKIEATLEKIGRARKIEVVKYKSKSRYFKRYGHRQPYFEIQITAIK